MVPEVTNSETIATTIKTSNNINIFFNLRLISIQKRAVISSSVPFIVKCCVQATSDYSSTLNCRTSGPTV